MNACQRSRKIEGLDQRAPLLEEKPLGAPNQRPQPNSPDGRTEPNDNCQGDGTCRLRPLDVVA